MSLGHYMVLIVFAYLSVMAAAFFGAFYGMVRVLEALPIFLDTAPSEAEDEEE